MFIVNFWCNCFDGLFEICWDYDCRMIKLNGTLRGCFSLDDCGFKYWWIEGTCFWFECDNFQPKFLTRKIIFLSEIVCFIQISEFQVFSCRLRRNRLTCLKFGHYEICFFFEVNVSSWYYAQKSSFNSIKAYEVLSYLSFL